MQDQLLTVAQTREYLQVSRTTVYQLIRSGELKSILLGSRIRRVLGSSVDELIAKRAKEGAA